MKAAILVIPCFAVFLYSAPVRSAVEVSLFLQEYENTCKSGCSYGPDLSGSDGPVGWSVGHTWTGQRPFGWEFFSSDNLLGAVLKVGIRAPRGLTIWAGGGAIETLVTMPSGLRGEASDYATSPVYMIELSHSSGPFLRYVGFTREHTLTVSEFDGTSSSRVDVETEHDRSALWVGYRFVLD